jgi:hypothetical protein
MKNFFFPSRKRVLPNLFHEQGSPRDGLEVLVKKKKIGMEISRSTREACFVEISRDEASLLV